MTKWPFVKLSELTTKVGSGATPRGGSNSYKETGTPLIRSMNVRFEGFTPKGLAFIDREQAKALASVEVQADDVLLNITGASIGRVTTAPREMAGARVNQHVAIVRCNEAVRPGFLTSYLASPSLQRRIDTDESGATRQALTKAKILDFDVPLPPLNEQKRIVAKIEALQAHSEGAKEALDAIPPLLEKFRQSVLAAAFRGDLTRAWREQHPDVEPASKLLERIRTERCRRWIEDAAEKARARAEAKARKAGKPWTDKDDARVLEKERAKAAKKYKEPEPVDPTGLSELPEGWCWATLGELADVKGGLTKGKKRRPEDDLREVPYLRVANVQRGYLDLSEVKTIVATTNEIEDLRLVAGDVLFNEGGDRDKLGRGWIWDDEIDLCIHQNHVFRARLLLDDVLPRFVSHYGNSEAAQFYFLRSGKQTTNLASINMTKLKALPVPLAPSAEQAHIVAAIELLFAGADGTKEAVTAQNELLGRLNQSILAKAFRGELVPQDPNDEPASVLLERIRAQREATEGNSASRRGTNAGGRDAARLIS